MKIDRLGERAAILRDFERDPAEFACAIEAARLEGLSEAVACYETVGVFVDRTFDLESLRGSFPSGRINTGRVHTIPVCYELGEDLHTVADSLQLQASSLASLHSSVEYRCFAIGFCPGFPYLGYLPKGLEGVPRLARPRTRVEPGSVAITGRQTGIYPLPRPGGWAIIGRTPTTIVDVEEGYFPIQAGDVVRFRPISEQEFVERQGERL